MMKTIRFDKMQGTGNDYIYVDARSETVENPESLAVKISDRHFGVGSDGLVLIMNSTTADFRMRMFNADGSESAMCGNASRCVGKYVYEKRLTDKTEIKLETNSGIKTLRLKINESKVQKVSVDMDIPLLEAEQIPVNYPDAMNVPIEGMNFICLSMGNPHAVTFMDNVAELNIEEIGRKVENHHLFPERTNVEFAQIISPERIRMRVWERGSGETLACGTGACATLVAAVLGGKAERKATLELRGGEVEIEWDEKTNRVTLTGGAEWVFTGEYKI
ncbi:MAG: diaminopimelate epimerase [Candidatus Azobacteroides sp.]|nr:diaminopimelate epimerase [Candidatus Azobacteroides sp.]